MIREICKDAESVRCGLSHVPSQPALSVGMPSRNDRPPDIWDTWYIGKSFWKSNSVFFGTLSERVQSVDFRHNGTHHRMSERQTPDTTSDPRCQSGPSAINSFDPSEGRFLKDYRADQQRLQISELHYDKFPNPATFACWKKRFKTEVCTCSQFVTEAMLWITEVEMAESVDDLKSSRSIRGTHGPDFEVLDARIASALNRIIQNTRFKKKVSLEEMKAHKEDRFLRGRQIAYLIDDHFRVIGSHDSVENYADLFTISLRNDDIQEFDTKWDEILLSMTQISPDDILEGLYKLRTRESEKHKTVLELYDLEIHQKKAGPVYH